MDAKSLTYALIADAFKNLMEKKDFNKITVKMIATESGIMRSTFYNYFQDKYEILEWIVKSEISDKVIILIEKEMYVESLNLMFSCVEDNRKFFKRAFAVTGQNSFEEILAAAFYDLFLEVYKSVDFNYNNKVINKESISKYQSVALATYIKMWVYDEYYGSDVSCGDICEAYMFMLTQSSSMISHSKLLESIADVVSKKLSISFKKFPDIISKKK